MYLRNRKSLMPESSCFFRKKKKIKFLFNILKRTILTLLQFCPFCFAKNIKVILQTVSELQILTINGHSKIYLCRYFFSCKKKFTCWNQIQFQIFAIIFTYYLFLNTSANDCLLSTETLHGFLWQDRKPGL